MIRREAPKTLPVSACLPLLAEVRRHARSRLQLRQADLVPAVANAIAWRSLPNLRFGLVQETARAVLGSSTVPFRDGEPLPALL